MAFTPEELAEMARADAEIEESFCISNEDIAFSRALDREAVLDGMDSRQRKIAESQRQYYAANKDKIAESKRAIRDARKRLGLTQRQFGALFEVKHCTISFWENISAPDNWREIVSVALGYGG